MFGDSHLVVVDLGFGDAGKGATVDWLCSPEADLAVAAVVRFNGGAQAAHNVIADGRHHTFAQFGAGTFAGVPTLLSRHMLVEPIALAAESDRLAALGVPDPLGLLAVDGQALLTTPIHIAANRAREDARGSSRHGSCGRGIGETAWYALEHDAPTVADCRTPSVLRAKLDRLAAHYDELIDPSGYGYEPIDVLVAMYGDFARAVRVVGDGELRRVARRGRLVFEGAQGVLLDEWRGFHPHTTWSTVEPRNARAMIAEVGGTAAVLGVTRTYMTRHGAGPLPTESPLDLPEPHNGTGPYQGAFRQGHLDPILLRYAIEVCGGIDGLVVNHLDTPETLCAAAAYDTAAGPLTELAPGRWRDLDHQQRLTDQLSSARPILEPISPDPAAWIADRLALPVVLTAHGPDRADRAAQSRRTGARKGVPLPASR
ncbi:adenylosuccinate synthetase [Nocardia mangyaensis]|uniref:adenylosuccinate synthetase n=1 Tax=Nocardia mangyaensis TaxID=2213200 RepID=UPI0026752627|nr:adenylosuccinate synthetase [Nocardia mangyaensis]MDO3646664.1 adenylosuccinate synthetase [Nocardia mangyaensis]